MKGVWTKLHKNKNCRDFGAYQNTNFLFAMKFYTWGNVSISTHLVLSIHTHWKLYRIDTFGIISPIITWYCAVEGIIGSLSLVNMDINISKWWIVRKECTKYCILYLLFKIAWGNVQVIKWFSKSLNEQLYGLNFVVVIMFGKFVSIWKVHSSSE